MQLTQLFLRKLKLQMRLLHIVEKRPNRIIKLDPIDPEDFSISEQAVKEWSENNTQLYELILQNGMAEFICNKDYLFEFYRHLSFTQKSINSIDEGSLRFKNVKILNLVRNNLRCIEHLPASCKELYLDFNQIEDINQKTSNSLELISLSHNVIGDAVCHKIVDTCQQLRCFNISWNRIQKMQQFVNLMKQLTKLKVLVAYGNPISMLALYYSYLTDHVPLMYIDGQKYVKQEEIKKVEEPKIEEKKEVKQEKKQSKKEAKKAGKVEEKPVQLPKVEPPKIQIKRQLTKEDFQKVKLTIKITNMEQFTGSCFDPSLFPADVDIKKTQTNYWLAYSMLGQQVQLKQKIVSFDNTTIENEETRLNLEATIQSEFVMSYDSFLKFNEGVKISVHQVQPKMIKDLDTFQLKPEINNGQVNMTSSVLGAVFLDLRQLHAAHKKQSRLKYRLFSSQAVKNPLFADPYENEEELIIQQKEQFEKNVKRKEQQTLKKIEEQELLKQQKKGGKDQKKPAEKKVVKKEGKDAVAVEKRKSQKCDYPLHTRQYCVLDGQKMHKGKSLLCVSVSIG